MSDSSNSQVEHLDSTDSDQFEEDVNGGYNNGLLLVIWMMVSRGGPIFFSLYELVKSSESPWKHSTIARFVRTKKALAMGAVGRDLYLWLFSPTGRSRELNALLVKKA